MAGCCSPRTSGSATGPTSWALQEGHLFCLVSGNLDLDGMTQAFLDALPKIERVAREDPVGFWHVYRDGQVKRMWP